MKKTAEAPKSDIFSFRVEKRVKRDAERYLHSIGLTIADAVRLFMYRVVMGEELPFGMSRAELGLAETDAPRKRRARKTSRKR